MFVKYIVRIIHTFACQNGTSNNPMIAKEDPVFKPVTLKI